MDKKMTFKMKSLLFMKKHKKNTTRHTLLATVVLLFLLILFPVWNYFLGQKTPVHEDARNTFTGSFVGDVAFNAYYETVVAKGRDKEFSRHLDSYLGTSDYVAGNIIGLTTDKETTLLKDFNISTVNIFNDSEFSASAVQMANTLEILDEKNITHVGQDAAATVKIIYQEINGIKMATIGINESRYATTLKVIGEAHRDADLVIVHLNWEEQYSSSVETEDRRIAEAISDAGADIIVGHNTEVLKPIEIYNDTVILYSLGNFLHGEVYSATNESALVQYVIGQNGSSLKVIPLNLAFGRPEPALGIFEVLTRYNIFKILTSELPEDSSWSIEGGILNVELD
ncbi:CapA family protein [Trichococcus sp.]|uniref:CapA family protein n=1 Tax=Trichococcus sp. TaxID=1985464 RepID=UPI003C7B9BD7